MGGSDNAATHCVGCGHRILDRYLLCIDGQMWHETCSVCTICLQPLEHTCHVRDGKLFCRYDYFRYFGVCCLGCGHPIFPQESVLRLDRSSQPVTDIEANDEAERSSWSNRQKVITCPQIPQNNELESTELLHFHQSCFTCFKCQRILCTGEPYILRDTLPLCYLDYQRELLLIEENARYCATAPVTSEAVVLTEPTVIIKHIASAVDLVPTSLESMLDVAKPGDELDPYELTSVATDYPSNSRAGSTDGSSRDRADEEEELFEIDSDSGSGKNSKRPRTILTATQRRRFKSVFEMNPKPARKMREALASETGLNIRVVQVWFQNQRAKVKKLARRQAQEALQQANRRLFTCQASMKETQIPAPQLITVDSSAARTSPTKQNGSTTSVYSFGLPNCSENCGTSPSCGQFVKFPLFTSNRRPWTICGEDISTLPFLLNNNNNNPVKTVNLPIESNQPLDQNSDPGQSLSPSRIPQLTPDPSAPVPATPTSAAQGHSTALPLFPSVPLLIGPFATDAMLPCFDQLQHGPSNTMVTDLTLPSPPMDKLFSMQQSYFLSN